MNRTGKVVQVSVSAGGVPKRAVEKAWVGLYGLEGDKHREDTVHGGPHRAVCLFGIEVIERLQSEGHPVEPGSVGENLTTSGIEWSLLPVGTRARIGDQLELEVSSSTTPCATQVRNFSDGNFNRIRIELHPADSRMYARVVTEGEVKPGDSITLTAPASDSRAEDELLMKMLDRAETKSSVAAWRAAQESGFAIDFVEDGELSMAASAELPGPAFNHSSGLARLPNLLSRVTDFYDRHGTTGYLWMTEQEPWPGAKREMAGAVFGGRPADVAEVPAPDGVVIRRLAPDEAGLYTMVRSNEFAPGGLKPGAPNPWPQVYENLAKRRARQLFVAEMDGKPVANASLHVVGSTGWLRGVLVAPEARGRGIQRALISFRARAAEESGCDLIGSQADPDGVSARNLAGCGLRLVARRDAYEYVPGQSPRPAQ